ncbi:AI-2E family transporter [Sporosalibacterium faouarense]|uniref:AI-2E family transporter n=1 Tax=Sporosalibacterium faouarense TaxID=516123 RepID=UPI00311C9E2D
MFLLVLAFILFKIINAPNFFPFVIKLIMPFIWAFLIAYILNPLMVILEKRANLKRIWSLLIIYVFLLGLITLIITIITPSIIDSFTNIRDNLPDYFSTTEKWLIEQSTKLSFLSKYGVVDSLEENLNGMVNTLSQNLSSTLKETISQLINITSAFLNFVLGIVISLYILKDKEFFARHLKRLLYSLLEEEKVDYLIKLGTELNVVFSKYLIGKLIDSIIIGILCFIGLIILGIPYSLIISSIVGVTNMIPYFGPFIGMVPAVIITLFYSPIRALWVAIFILALQQFDGLYLGPKILGTQVGLKPFWVISAIIIGGALFGVLGMLLAIPITGMIKVILNKFVTSRLENKNIKL